MHARTPAAHIRPSYDSESEDNALHLLDDDDASRSPPFGRAQGRGKSNLSDGQVSLVEGDPLKATELERLA